MLVPPKGDLISQQNCLSMVLDTCVIVPEHSNEGSRKARDVSYLACDCNWCWS